MTPKLLPESRVLSPRDPSLSSTDDWPEYRLNDVTVTLPGKPLSEPVSLFVASEHHPVSVIGKLDSVPEEWAHTYMLSSKQKKATIEVSEVRSYAYGDHEDGSVEIWAAGGAGWFSINPSKAFRETYNQMTEAVKVLFFIVDAYQTARKNGKGRNAVVLPAYTARELFEKYANEVLDDDSGAQEAMELIHRHREFLISSFLTGKEGIAWSGNPLYKHLYKKFPGDFNRIRQRLAGPDSAVRKAPPASAHIRQISADSESTTSSLRRKRGRPPKNSPSDAISIASSSVASSAVKEVQTDKQKVKPTKPTSNGPTSSLRQNSRRLKSSVPRSGTGTPEVPESQFETQTQDSDTDASRHRHKRKSALRLKPNKPSKGPPKSSKVATAVEDEDDEPEPPPSPPPNGKRKRDEPNGTARRPSKRRSSKYEVDEGIDIPASPSSEEVADSPDADPGATDTALPLRLNHRPDPIQEDTWICALDGCTHKVYAASLPESQKLIREHYALHAYDDDERVQLVKRLEAPSMPVSHLMDKVRMQARLEGFPGSRVAGTRFPEPLKMKY
jgi:hypothetical protein